MRLASYNVENVIKRARVLNLESWNDGRPVLEAYGELQMLLARETYDGDTRQRMRDLLVALGLDKSRRSRFVTLVEQRGELAGMTALRGLRVVARNRADWVGWFEFEMESLPPRTTFNAGQVVRDLAADVIAFQETESRSALTSLVRDVVTGVGGAAYGHVAHFSGNDDRGLGLGLATRPGFTIGWMRSHADERDANQQLIHRRDAPELAIWTPSGAVLWVILAHFRSRGYGRKDEADALRKAQAAAVAASYARLVKEGARFVAICADLGDLPDSECLSPLVRRTDLKDVTIHPAYATDGHVGTFGRGTAKEKVDYILLSPDLFDRMRGGGVWRRGVWGPGKLPAWDIYPEIKSSYDAASDHAALWCDLDI